MLLHKIYSIIGNLTSIYTAQYIMDHMFFYIFALLLIFDIISVFSHKYSKMVYAFDPNL